MSEPWELNSQPSMFSVEDFPASRTPLLADVPAPTTSATCGLNTLDSFASFNPDGSWRKTSQGYSQVTLDGSLERFSETWPRAGMTRSGIAYRRPIWGPRILESGSGLWPTPCAQEDGKTPEAHLAMKARMKGGPRYTITSLQVAAKMWPTPDTHQGGRTLHNVEYRGKSAYAPNGVKRAISMENAARMWSSPTVRDANTLAKVTRGRGSFAKGHEIIQPLPVQVGGTLNPTWVEWLMGYPLGWTVCEGWGTRSSRKSRSGSPVASSTPK